MRGKNTFISSVLLIVMSQFVMASSSKVLLIPAPHYSHINFFTVAAKTLKDEGHDVTVMIYDKYLKKIEKENVTSLAYTLSRESDLPRNVGYLISETSNSDRNILHEAYSLYSRLITIVDNFCSEMLSKDDLMLRVKEAHFDLVILDNLPPIACIHLIPYRFDIPYIALGNFLQPWKAGVSSFPPHELPLFISQNSRTTTLGQRLLSTVLTPLYSIFIPLVFSNTLVTEFAPEKPYKSIKQLSEAAEMTLINVEITCFDFPKLSAPNYQFIGSLGGAVKVEPLQDEFKSFADDATEGLIIISFGSMIGLRRSITNRISMLVEALGKMNERAILQFTTSELGDTKIPENVLVREWLPQRDLLAHPNTKLFIAHGGINGHMEATYIGVPILTMPFQQEQERNGARAEAKGHGKMLIWDETNTEEIYQTIRALIDDKYYKQNILKCAYILKDIPSARELLAFWVNHVLKYGADHLRPFAAEMPFYQFFGLDILAVFMTSFIVFIWITCTCCRFCCKKCSVTKSKYKIVLNSKVHSKNNET